MSNCYDHSIKKNMLDTVYGTRKELKDIIAFFKLIASISCDLSCVINLYVIINAPYNLLV